NAITRDRKGLPIRAYIKDIVIKCVWAVEISWLAKRVRRWIAKACDIAQTRIADKTDGLESCGAFRVGNAIGKLFHKRKVVVRDQIRTGCAQRPAHDLEAIWHFYVGRLIARLAGRRVQKFVDTVLVIVRREEYHVHNLVICDEF